MQSVSHDITIFLIVISSVILSMTTFIVLIIFLYQKKQQIFEKSLFEMKLDQEKIILNAQLEMQEQTFKHISKEIHDNISLSLTLAKLNLNTLNLDNRRNTEVKIESSIDLLSSSIAQLRDLSKSLDSDLIEKNGLLCAIDEEVKRIQKLDFFSVEFMITGIPVYMNSGDELIIFRIIQEAFNNIIKHAEAKNIYLSLNYEQDKLNIQIRDNGIGFDSTSLYNQQAGLKNMDARVKLLGGRMYIISDIGKGTTLKFIMPLNHE